MTSSYTVYELDSKVERAGQLVERAGQPCKAWTVLNLLKFLDIWEEKSGNGELKNPSGLNRVNELTLTTAFVTTTKGIYLPTTTVFRISLVAPVIVIQLIYPIIFWSVTVLVDNIILEPTFVVYQTKP